jgi:hypothetical protein
MKQLAVILSVIFFAACKPSKPSVPNYNKNSVFTVIYTLNGGKPGTQTQGRLDSVYYVPAFKDSSSLEVYWKLDSVWSLLVPNMRDTIRKPDNKPLYDSASHQYRFNSMWYRLTPEDRKTVKIQIITI